MKCFDVSSLLLRIQWSGIKQILIYQSSYTTIHSYTVVHEQCHVMYTHTHTHTRYCLFSVNISVPENIRESSCTLSPLASPNTWNLKFECILNLYSYKCMMWIHCRPWLHHLVLNYSGTSIMRTPLVPSEVSWVKRCPYFGVFLVGVAMRTRAVESYEGAVPELSLAIRWQERVTRG